MKEEAKMPVILTENVSEPGIVDRFLKTFGPGYPTGIPTACSLEGRRSEKLSALIRWSDGDEVYVYWDYGSSLRKDFISNVALFLSTREPWEDYDFCIFPASLDWCVGVTHNDYCVLVLRDAEPIQRGTDNDGAAPHRV